MNSSVTTWHNYLPLFSGFSVIIFFNLNFFTFFPLFSLFIATYTYTINLELNRNGNDKLYYTNKLSDPLSEQYNKLATISHDSIDRMVMQSDLRDIYHGIHITGFNKTKQNNGIISEFSLQLSDNTNEERLIDVFKKYLRGNNYSLGGTELYAGSVVGGPTNDGLKAFGMYY